MSSIKSREHFVNYIKVCISNNKTVKKENLLKPDEYASIIYENHLTRDFIWQLHNDNSILEESNLTQWLKDRELYIKLKLREDYQHIHTEEFIELSENLERISGVYLFSTEEHPNAYIGMSINLQARMFGSFKERFSRWDKPVYFKYIKTITQSDAALLEVYLIGLLKPTLNGSAKYNDDLTLKIIDIPEFSEPILCNII